MASLKQGDSLNFSRRQKVNEVGYKKELKNAAR